MTDAEAMIWAAAFVQKSEYGTVDAVGWAASRVMMIRKADTPYEKSGRLLHEFRAHKRGVPPDAAELMLAIEQRDDWANKVAEAVGCRPGLDAPEVILSTIRRIAK